MTILEPPRLDAESDAVLGPLVRVIEEAAGEQPWALVGASAIQLHGISTSAPNLEFVTTDSALNQLAEMLDVPVTWQRGAYVASARLQFMRSRVPVFVHGSPTFHGAYVSLTPVDIPALWDARTHVDVNGTVVLATPLEWELLLAVVLGNAERAGTIGDHLRAEGHDGRLLIRLMREGHVGSETEEAVWKHLER
ncbi:MAG: hypothetical protein F4Z08_07300 [Chloroflexi bacterium]|nr:hypothetical protein [Chloroflexota bacterium]